MGSSLNTSPPLYATSMCGGSVWLCVAVYVFLVHRLWLALTPQQTDVADSDVRWDCVPLVHAPTHALPTVFGVRIDLGGGAGACTAADTVCVVWCACFVCTSFCAIAFFILFVAATLVDGTHQLVHWKAKSQPGSIEWVGEPLQVRYSTHGEGGCTLQHSADICCGHPDCVGNTRPLLFVCCASKSIPVGGGGECCLNRVSCG